MTAYNKLKHFRLEKRLSLRELSSLCEGNPTPSTLCFIENGKCKARGATQKVIAEALELPVNIVFPTDILPLTKSDLAKKVKLFRQSDSYKTVERRTPAELLTAFIDFIYEG